MLSFVILVATSAIVSSQPLGSEKTVQLDVYYEGQCPGCHDFFIDQLRPTAKILSPYIYVNLVPYGNTWTYRKGGEVTFQCQHGPSECLLDKIHACSFELMKTDNLQKVLMASCLFDYDQTPLEAGEKCAAEFGLKWNEVDDCVDGPEGTRLIDGYGNETNSLNPPHPYTPYIAVDKYVGDDDYQTRIREDLTGVVCETLAKKKATPEACKGKDE